MQCSPTSVHREEGEEDDQIATPLERRTRTASTRVDAPQKPDRPYTQAGVANADDGSGGLLSQLSMRTEDWDREARLAAEVWMSGVCERLRRLNVEASLAFIMSQPQEISSRNRMEEIPDIPSRAETPITLLITFLIRGRKLLTLSFRRIETSS